MDTKTSQKKTFLQRIKHSNYIVRDHRVHGVRMLPGVVLLDMIYRLAAEYLGTKEIELRKIVFKQPVVTSDHFDKKVLVTFSSNETHWNVSVDSQKETSNGNIDDRSDENMECLLVLKKESKEGKRLDIETLINNSKLIWDMDDVYGLIRKVDISHFEFMKTMGTIYQHNNEEVMKLHLSELAEKYRPKFHAHPAFLDGATLAGLSFRLDHGRKQNLDGMITYLPFAIERFCIHRTLPKTIYTYTKKADHIAGDLNELPDIASTDISVFDEQGRLLLEFDRLTVKKIREPELIKKLIEPDDDTAIKPAAKTNTISVEAEHKTQDSKDPSAMKHPAQSAADRIFGYLKDEIGKVLKKKDDDIDIHTGFYDLGLDSTNLLSIVKNLERKLDIQLYPTLLFEYSDIKQLTEYLVENHGDEVLASDSRDDHSDECDDPHYTQSRLMFYEPVWHQQALNDHKYSFTHDLRRMIILYDGSPDFYIKLKNHMPGADAVALESIQEIIPRQFEDKCRQTLCILQEKLKQKQHGEILLQVLADAQSKYVHALGGLLRTASLENPKVHGQIIAIERLESQSIRTVIDCLRNEALFHTKGDVEIKYQGKTLQRFTMRLVENELASEHLKPGYKEQGVYVVTGGLGGLGLLIADHITRQTNIRLVLIGRSALNAEKEEIIGQIRNRGSEVLYLAADVGEQSDVDRVFAVIKKEMGSITGIFHSAGVIKDQLIIEKDLSELKRVFCPKVAGAWYLDKITKDEQLDFFVMFSSLSAITGNIGQADYASANAFMDHFAQYRREKVEQGLRHGKTIAINWPLWADGGMQPGHELEQMMYASAGLRKMPTPAGFEALDAILNQNAPQVVVLYGEENKMRDYLGAYISAKEEYHKSNSESSVCENALKKEKNIIQSNNRNEDIAIIGLSGRYPEADTIEQFYLNLKNGKDCISRLPKGRWNHYPFAFDVEQFYQYGGFLDRIDLFDALFFNIAPRQAVQIDPQARLFLETAWEACEDAGFYHDRTKDHFPSSGNESVGVFVGVFWNHYELFAAEMTQRGEPTSFGGSPASIPNIVSYCLNFHGPSMAVDTMCSSALTCLHLACESIRKSECRYAIAGGVNLVTHPHKYMFLTQAGFLSSDGRCRSFGEGGDGYVPGEGVGAVLLTNLETAEKNGHCIYGVIKGSALNHVGKSSGATVPDPVAQAEVIADALKKSGINPRTISYIEAHGTGTSLGDPIEIHGLKKAFDEWTRDKQFCAIGSAKSNIGHLEAAAGIAGLTKLLLQLKHKQIFPSLHSNKLNPNIPFTETPFYVENNLKQWQRPEITINGKRTTIPRRAGLSSFGANGSNAHIIIEEYIPHQTPQKVITKGKTDPFLVPLSAKNKERARVYAKKLLEFLRKNQDVGAYDTNIEDLAYTLQIGREAMQYRIAFIVLDTAELMQKLQLYIDGKEDVENCFHGRVKKGLDSISAHHLDPDKQTNVDGSLLKDNPYELARLWVNGLNPDWHALYGDGRPRRIGLPTYPFERKRYWIPEGETEANTSGNASQAPSIKTAGEPTVGNILLKPIWDAVRVDDQEIGPVADEQVIIIGGDDKNRSAVRRVYANARVLDIQPEDTIEAIAEKVEAPGPVEHIIWMASHDSPSSTLADDAFIEGQNHGVLQVFRIIKALLRSGYGARNLRWTIITIQTQAVHNKDAVDPTHATVHGLAGSMAKEYPKWNVRLVDLEAGRDWPIDEIFTLSPDPMGNAWAYRGREWYRQKLIQLHPFQPGQSLYRSGGGCMW